VRKSRAAPQRQPRSNAAATLDEISSGEDNIDDAKLCAAPDSAQRSALAPSLSSRVTFVRLPLFSFFSVFAFVLFFARLLLFAASFPPPFFLLLDRTCRSDHG
jgi:hypothetical protein